MEQPNDNADAAETTQGENRDPSDLGPSSAIGKRLKAYYDDVASEPVPDRFMALLDQLDAAETVTKTSNRS